MPDILSTKKEVEKKGRHGDKIIAHLTPGEIVIPRAFAEDDDFRAVIATFFDKNGVSLEQYIVGSGKNKTNPKTGYMEFGLWGEIKKGFKAFIQPDIKALKEAKRVWRKVSPKPPKPVEPPKPLSPPATPLPGRGMSVAAEKTRRRRRGVGRESNILAGRQQLGILHGR